MKNFITNTNPIIWVLVGFTAVLVLSLYVTENNRKGWQQAAIEAREEAATQQYLAAGFRRDTLLLAQKMGVLSFGENTIDWAAAHRVIPNQREHIARLRNERDWYATAEEQLRLERVTLLREMEELRTALAQERTDNEELIEILLECQKLRHQLLEELKNLNAEKREGNLFWWLTERRLVDGRLVTLPEAALYGAIEGAIMSATGEAHQELGRELGSIFVELFNSIK